MKIIETERASNEIELNSWKISSGYGIMASPSGKTLVLEPRLSKLMYLLCNNAGAIIARDYLVENIWNDTVVNEESLTRAIADLRKTLLKNFGNDIKIETIPKRGYRLSLQTNPRIRKLKLRIKRPAPYTIFGSVLFVLTLLWYTGFLKIVVV